MESVTHCLVSVAVPLFLIELVLAKIIFFQGIGHVQKRVWSIIGLFLELGSMFILLVLPSTALKGKMIH